MKETNYMKAQRCVDNIVRGWGKTNLSDLEKYCREWWLVEGAVDMAMYYLSYKDYEKLKSYIRVEYGFVV